MLVARIRLNIAIPLLNPHLLQLSPRSTTARERNQCQPGVRS